MATFFGEVLSVYSRAVEEYDEDLEEDEEIRKELEEKRELRLEWYPDVQQTLVSEGSVLRCSHLIVAVGDNATGFLSAYVLHTASWSPVGGVSWAGCGPAGAQPVCVFYRQTDGPSVLICQITGYISEDQQFEWAEKVLGCLQQRGLNVTVLSDTPVSEYKAPDGPCTGSTPFLRRLHTDGSGSQAVCPPLEQPNIVTGLPAAVLGHCQVHRIPAVAYQCYSDVISPDSVTMETYKPALTALNTSIKFDASPSTDILRKFVKASEIQSNLYI